MVIAILIAALLVFPPGCGVIQALPFRVGTYSADLPCTLEVTTAEGQVSTLEFTTAISLTVDTTGTFSVNDVELVEGNEVVRSIPTADLAFEIVSVTRVGPLLTVMYEPRPTLPGITVEGDLVETYRWRSGEIVASGQTNLEVTDVSTTTLFTGSCEGTLIATGEH